MIIVVLVVALLACIRVIIATVDITDATCIVGKWLGHLSFGLFFGAVILKTWRVNMVVSSTVAWSEWRSPHHKQFELHPQLRVVVCSWCATCLLPAGGNLRRLTSSLLRISYDGENVIRNIKCSSKCPQITAVLVSHPGGTIAVLGSQALLVHEECSGCCDWLSVHCFGSLFLLPFFFNF